MKKLYSKPLTEVVTYNLETFIAASVKSTEGLDDDDLVVSEEKVTNFSKQYDLWEFEQEN